MAIDADVERAVACAFAPADRADVLDALALYEGSETARVWLAVLALADGDASKVWTYVDSACADFRDVVFWAEYASRRDRPRMAERYRRLGVAVPETLRRR